MEILNRIEHCVSNSTVEELETELTFEANKNSKETPLGMKTTPEFNTGIAWDKFDHVAETEQQKYIALYCRNCISNARCTNDQYNSYAFRKI